MNDDELPVSVGQRLLWFMEHYRGQSGALNCPLVLRLRGRLDRAHLQSALNLLLARHETLRTTFRGKGRKLGQRIHPPRHVDIGDFDLAGGAGDALGAAIREELTRRIDPESWPMRVAVWRLGEEEHVLCLNMHHLVTDGRSCGILVRDLSRLYARAMGREAELPEIAWPYQRFVERESEWLKSADFRRQLDYWQAQLAGAKAPALALAGAPPNGSRRTATHSLDLGEDVLIRLRALASARRTTLFNVMLAIYYEVLHRLTGQEDLSVGSIFLNRGAPELRETVGFFANLLVLRTHVPDAAPFAELLRRSHATVMDALMHQAVSFYFLPSKMVESSSLRADEIVFQMMPEPLRAGFMGDVRFEPMPIEGVGNRFELELAVVMGDRGMSAVVSHNQDRVPPAWANALLKTYVAAAEEAASASSALN